jgi:hypothetical protein
MNLRLGYLYPDLMNLYGDRGNILTLKKRCEWCGIDFEITGITVGQKLETKKFDLFFFGGGQDQQQKIVAADLKRKSGWLKKAAEDGKVFLTVCGGFQLLARYYQPFDGPKLWGVGIFDAYTVASNYRCIGNVLIESQIGNAPTLPRRFGRGADYPSARSEFPCRDVGVGKKIKIVGFENHSGQTYLGKKCRPLGKVLKGFGNNVKQKIEGAIYKNCYGTYIHGPLLPKNPKLADHLIKLALEQKYQKEIELKKLDDSLENLAFENACRAR